ncbi:CU044_5270 family protein [Cellulomonas sp. PhB143]|uniref:CU044_5270 family protein n=1 Tax=Cellulomonas sp. PhB143 TaxID=2485186 RepID=UPI000F485440|nr:CU044_5270 family protein [Cellulomonas sp. PhB143]ROS72087.1 hypothetical protein EDF32_2831 [Cellulomonas sp. PhB143]
MTRLLDDPTLARLSQTDPHPTTPLSGAEGARAEALLLRLTTTPRTPGRDRTRVSTKVRVRIAAAGVAAVAVVGASVLAVGPASATDVLMQAADGAAAQPAATSGEYWYVRSTVRDGSQLPYEREIWKSKDETVLRDGASAALAAAEAGADELDPALIRTERISDSTEGGTRPTTFGDETSLTWDELDALPTDPAKLRKVLDERLADYDVDPDYKLWNEITALLSESPATPELRRALWEVAATVPGVELLGTTADSAGHDGTAIELDLTARRLPRYTVVVDPTDGTLLESRIESGGQQLVDTLVDQGPTDTVPEVQPPLCGPGSVPETSC